jgi:hypothetical protein
MNSSLLFRKFTSSALCLSGFLSRLLQSLITEIRKSTGSCSFAPPHLFSKSQNPQQRGCNTGHGDWKTDYYKCYRLFSMSLGAAICLPKFLQSWKNKKVNKLWGLVKLSSIKLTCFLRVSWCLRLFTHDSAVNLRKKKHSWKLMLAGKTSSQNLTIESHGIFALVRSLHLKKFNRLCHVCCRLCSYCWLMQNARNTSSVIKWRREDWVFKI